MITDLYEIAGNAATEASTTFVPVEDPSEASADYTVHIADAVAEAVTQAIRERIRRLMIANYGTSHEFLSWDLRTTKNVLEYLDEITGVHTDAH